MGFISQHKKIDSQHLATNVGDEFYYNECNTRTKNSYRIIRFSKEEKLCESQYVMTKRTLES